MFSIKIEPERKLGWAVVVWRKIGVLVTVASRIDSAPVVFSNKDR
jgi:hypothetical protein